MPEAWTYDRLGRVTRHTDALAPPPFRPYCLGQTNQVKNQISGLVGTNWFYDSNLNDRRLTGIANRSGGSHFSYVTTPEYDFASISESRLGQTWRYTYDKADRLIAAASSLGATITSCPGVTGNVTDCYGYDPASNLTSIGTPARTTSVTPTLTNAVAAAGSTNFRYDANGNLLQDYARSYAWDAENRLIQITGTANGAPYTSNFGYDGLNRRVAIATSGGVTATLHYGWCGQTLCQERNAADAPLRRYLPEGEYDATLGALVYGRDHLGSVRDVIAAPRGRNTNHFDYDPYGNPTTATGSRATWADFRYAGLFYHHTSGLYLATYRAYDPVLGRWLSRDPIGELGGVNLYGYVAGNPIEHGDPLGQNCANCIGPPERQTEYEEAKNYCDNPPPPGSNWCATLSNQIQHAKRCISL